MSNKDAVLEEETVANDLASYVKNLSVTLLLSSPQPCNSIIAISCTQCQALRCICRLSCRALVAWQGMRPLALSFDAAWEAAVSAVQLA